MASNTSKGRQNKRPLELYERSGCRLGEARMSPWGLQRFAEDRDVWVPIMWDWPNAVRGRWLLRNGYQCISNGCKSYCLGHAVLKLTLRVIKSDLDAFAGGEEIEPKWNLEDRAGDAYPASTTPCTSRHRLAALPQAILQQILGYLVPRGSAYQFFYVRRKNKPLAMVQQFIPANEHGLGSAHLALAGTSRYWRDVVYSMFYGMNTFAFNIGTTTMQISVGSHSFPRFESWIKVLSEEHSGPLGPMNQVTAKYLKSAILLFAYPVSLGSKEVGRLADVVTRAASMLESATLSKLQIHLEALGRVDEKYDTIPVDSLDVDFCGTTNVMQVKVRDPRVVPPSGRSNKVQRAFEPLLKLKAVSEPVISGLIAEDFAQELKDNITVARTGAWDSPRFS
ncbi:hypothetical protein DL771_002681 [Monosporascus sp. 5C6A]|nr:hypothetical protein DL771_002681 [Monosporascus sp. 5C6A]